MTHGRWCEASIRLEHCTIASFLSNFCDISRANFKDLPRSIRTIGMTDSHNKGCDIFRLGKHIYSTEKRLAFMKRLTLIFANISGGMTVSVIGDAASCALIISNIMEQES